MCSIVFLFHTSEPRKWFYMCKDTSLKTTHCSLRQQPSPSAAWACGSFAIILRYLAVALLRKVFFREPIFRWALADLRLQYAPDAVTQRVLRAAKMASKPQMTGVQHVATGKMAVCAGYALRLPGGIRQRWNFGAFLPIAGRWHSFRWRWSISSVLGLVPISLQDFLPFSSFFY